MFAKWIDRAVSSDVWLAALLVGAGLVAASCGPEQQRDPCDGVDCEFGSCESSSGECVNREVCDVDADCLVGYECRDSECAAIEECGADDECDPGVCSDEVCVNPDTCSEDADCRARTYCAVESGEEEGSCEPDPCNEIQCPRGVCERGTNECVSAETCTERTEHLDCLAGQRCAVPDGEQEGTCLEADAFCDAITCGRGVCAFEAGGCTDATDCEGDDARCTEGKFCNDMNRCQVNRCVEQGIDCEDAGVCVPASGECENAESCSSSDDCVNQPAHLCVEGTCRLESAACGDAGGDGGCPGNQICEYDEEASSAECVEPETCETSIDCTEGRECSGERCIEASECSEDAFEPNDGEGEATNFDRHAFRNTLSASMCAGDVDRYTLETSESVGTDSAANLLVELDVRRRQIGLGGLDLRVLGPDGEEVGSASTGAMGAEGHVETSVAIGADEHGSYTLEVSSAEDVTSSGVDYELSANFVSPESNQACADAPRVAAGEKITGRFGNATSSSLGSNCTSDGNGAAEKIYALELETAQELTFTLTSSSNSADLSMDVRSRCTEPGTERACANDAGAGGEETMTVVLGEGTHYLVVQPDEPGLGGPFEVAVERTNVACDSTDNRCRASGEALVCEPRGGRFREVICSDRCETSTGRCAPVEGDQCVNAPTMSPEEVGPTTLQLDGARDRYRVPTGGCLEDEATSTDGPDMPIRVEVPANQGFTADVTFENDAEGAAYVLEDCGGADGRCLIGENDSTDQASTEEVVYANLSDEAETVYLVVDTGESQPVTGASVELEYREVTCWPNTKRCDGSGGVEQCSPTGAEWQDPESCPNGCNDGGCRGQTCANAIPIPNSQEDKGETHEFIAKTDEFEYGNDYQLELPASDDGPVCDVQENDFGGEANGKDAVFAIDADQGDTIDLTWSLNDGFLSIDPMVYVVTDCSEIDRTCRAGHIPLSGNESSVTFRAEQSTTHYVIADFDCGSFCFYPAEMKLEVTVE